MHSEIDVEDKQIVTASRIKEEIKEKAKPEKKKIIR